MDLRTTRSKLVPMVGGVTAAAAVVGAAAPMAHVAPAGAEAGGVTAALGSAGLVGAGTFESCAPYFGYGKESGVLGLVQFDVADINGADGVDHAVPTDVDVVLVLENEDGDIAECVPEEVSQATWEEQFDGESNLPDWPGPGHYVYPSVALSPELDGFGVITSVGFRVAGIPVEHTLVSPEGTKELAELFYDAEGELFFGDVRDPRVLALIASEAGDAAATAYTQALIDCSDETAIDGTDPELLAGADVLATLIGEGLGDETEVDCFDVHILHALGSTYLSVFESIDYVEEIRLSVPEAPVPPPVAPPAAQPVTAAPQFTG